MSRPYEFQPYPETRFASGAKQRVVSVLPAARRNRLLAALPAQEFERLLPDLEPVPLPMGWTIHGAGGRERYLYFPTAGIVSRFYVTRAGASASLALTGSEGVIGVAAFLGGESTLSQAVVLSTGYAYRLPADRVKGEFEHDGALANVLLRYTQALIAHTGQIAACYRHHLLEQQLCRWILSCLDRLSSDELTMTQAVIADMLGVRREGVTEAAGRLQRAGLIRCSHGHIAVLDRPRLEARVCECYAVIKQEYQRLLRPSGARDNACRSRHGLSAAYRHGTRATLN